MIELEEALQRILDAIPPAQSERVQVGRCSGRILAETVLSPGNLPAFDNSGMDGYAVRAADVASASATKPVRLRVLAKVPAGSVFTGEVAAGQCIRLFTGSPMPAGADAVVMQEDTQTDPAQPDEVLILDAAKPFENVRLRGTDVKAGSVIGNVGDIVNIGRLNLLASGGIAEINVGKSPTVGLLATGSELREAGQPLSPGQIYESNRLMLAAMCQKVGAVPQIYPLVADTADETRKALHTAFDQSDVVVTSGGVSVGEMDFVKTAFEEIGGKLEFWKVAIRPGRPFVFGRLGNKFLFGLPGNPVSASVTFLLLVRPALLRWQGAVETHLPVHPGVLGEPMTNPGERRHFARVKIDDSGKVFSSGLQASHAIRSLAEANGLVDVPARANLAAGETVSVMRWAD